MIKQLKKDNKNICNVQFSSDSQQQEDYHHHNLLQIYQFQNLKKQKSANANINVEKNNQKEKFDLGIHNNNKNNLDTNGIGNKQKQPIKITLKTGNISKMTFIDDSQQSQNSEKQEDNINNTSDSQTQIKNNPQSQIKNIQMPKFSQLRSLNMPQKQQKSFFSKQIEYSQNKINKSQKKINLSRGIGQMQSSRIVNNFSLTCGLLGNNDEIDYNQFQALTSRTKPIKQYFVTNTDRKPKQFAKNNNIQEKYNKKVNLNSFSSPLVDFGLNNDQNKKSIQQENLKDSNQSIMNKYQEYNPKNQNKKQENNYLKQDQNSSSEKQEQQEMIQQSQQIKQQEQLDKITGQQSQQIQNPNISQNKSQNLLQPSEIYIKNGIQIAEKIAQGGTLGDLVQFLLNPIPKKTRMEFQVIRVKSLLQVSYQFWLILPNKKIRLMIGVSNSINIQSTVFHILLGTDYNINLNLATMRSDFKRQQFYLCSNQSKFPKILAAISTKISINTKKRMQLYTPILNQKKDQFKPIFMNKISNNMRKLFGMASFNGQIDKLNSVAIHLKEWNTMVDKYGIRMSKRNILMSNLNKQFVFFMGKTEKDHYYLPSLGGLSPMQLFSFAIFQLFK